MESATPFDLLPLDGCLDPGEDSYRIGIIDIGSNKGQFSILAKSLFPTAKVYSFEPQIEYLNLQKVILGRKKVKYFNFGLGNIDMDVKIVNYNPLKLIQLLLYF